MFEQLGNNFANMIQLQKINNKNIPNRALCPYIWLRNVGAAWFLWEVRGNYITLRQRVNKRQIRVFSHALSCSPSKRWCARGLILAFPFTLFL